MGNANSGRNSGRPLLTDAQILEIRALDVYANWGKRKIADFMGLDLAAVGRVVDGFTKGSLIPTRKHLPGGIT